MKNLKKLLIYKYIVLCSFFIGCVQNNKDNLFTQDLFSPIVLFDDTTNISDSYFLIGRVIDSIHSEITHIKHKDKIILIADEHTPSLSNLRIWTDGESFDILVKNRLKKKYNFRYKSKISTNSQVSIVGDFNEWNPNANLLHYNKENNLWETNLFIDYGSHEYKIVINNEWLIDKNNDKIKIKSGGNKNSVLVFKNDEHKSLYLDARIKSNKIFIDKEPESTVLAFWNNHKIEMNDTFLIVPEKAKKVGYSHIRVFSMKSNLESNSLLIPLFNGNVINNFTDLDKNDKYSKSLYFILIDRFFNGNLKNDFPIDDSDVHPKANYMGGDIEGITQKIKDGYFDSLNINSIWLSPITQNPLYAEIEYPYPHRKYSGYHGYWPVSCTDIDYRFGDTKSLKKMIEEAHKKNIKVLLDYVSNHVHETNPLIINNPEWSTDFILEDGKENIRIWDEERLTTWFDRFLPSIDYSIPEAVDAMTDSALYMLEKYNLDGFRHDATKHIPEIFWETLTLKIKKKYPNKKIYQIGETFGSRELIGRYISSGKLDGQFDFNLYFDMRNVFATESSFKILNNSLLNTFSYYGDFSLMGNITGNHDIPRFISYASNSLSFEEDEKEAGWNRNLEIIDTIGYNKLKMLTAFISTIPGIPVIYYGDEIGMIGAGDPDNRRMMNFEKLSQNQMSIKSNLSKLLKLRKQRLSLIYGSFKCIHVCDNLYVYQRTYFDEKTIVFLNKSENIIEYDLYEYENKFKVHFGSKIKDNKLLLKPYSHEILTIN